MHAGHPRHQTRSAQIPAAAVRPTSGPLTVRSDVAFGRRRATANAAAVAAAPSLARLPAKNEVLVGRAAPGERLVIPAGEGGGRGGRNGPSRSLPQCGMPPRRSDTQRGAEADGPPIPWPRGGSGGRSVQRTTSAASGLRLGHRQLTERSGEELGAWLEHAEAAEKKRRERAHERRKGC
jgi:hypothetical protein